MTQDSPSTKSPVRRFGIYNILGFVCIALMAYSFILPWWFIRFLGEYRPWEIDVYPYGAFGELPVVGNPTDPRYFIAFTAGFAVCITLAFLGSVLKGNKGKILLGAAGVTMLGVAYTFFDRIIARTRTEGLIPQGIDRPSQGLGMFVVETGFREGLSYAFYVGALCIIVAVFGVVYAKLRRKS